MVTCPWHVCTAQAAADPRKASYCHGTCSRLSQQGPQTHRQLLQPVMSLTRGSLTRQAPNEGRREKHPRHHKQLPSSGSGCSLAKGTDVLIALISPENATWLILHVFFSLEEEGKDKKSVSNTQYSTYLKATTSRHICWFHCVHTSCRDLPCSLHLREQPDTECKIKGQCLSI